MNLPEDSLARLEVIVQTCPSFHHGTHILYDLRTKLGAEPKIYLEIGVYGGATSALIASHPYPTEVHGIDIGTITPFGDVPYEKVLNQAIDTFRTPQSSFQLHLGDSKSPSLISAIKKTVKLVDMLFIDGDHSFWGCTEDFMIYSPLVQSGGYIIFDDYNDYEFSPEVRKSVDALVYSGNSSIPTTYEVIGQIKNEFVLRKL